MISIAGGEDVAGPPGLKSPEVGWGALAGLDPDVVVAMPCGWYVERRAARRRSSTGSGSTALGAERVFAVDAASTFSRPGPRLVDGVELLGHLLHPDLVDPPGSIGFAELRAARRAQARRRRPRSRGRRSRGHRRAARSASRLRPEHPRVRRRGSSKRAERRPPTRPPRWPPTLMSATPKVKRQVDHEQERRSPTRSALKPRPRAITKVAPKMPKIAPEAPTVSSCGSVSSSAPKEPASSEAK